MRFLLVAAALAAVVAGLYARTYSFEFIDYDDPHIILRNAHVNTGLTWDGIRWAFTTTDFFYWQPLTWISHMIDCQLFGLQPGPPHLINAGLHMLNSLLVFGLLYYVTGRFWRSSFVGAVFAMHPLRVESVAWAGERKDVLSGFFFLVTLCLWVWYTQAPGSRRRYALVLTAFALALMSKPAVVMLPVLLLALDYWPLERGAHWRDVVPLVREKLPLFAASAVVSLITLTGNANQGSLIDTNILPFDVRMANTLLSYSKYIVKFFFPGRLAMLYPYTLPSLEELAISTAMLLFLTGASLLYGRRYPYLPAGWLWFLAAILPMSGLMQTGSQAMADRFTYLALIGLATAVTWGAADLLEDWPRVTAAWAAATILAMGAVSWIQVGYWSDSITLYRHTLAVTADNLRIQENLGGVLYRASQMEGAEACYREAVRISPERIDDRLLLAQILREERKYDEAVEEYRKALRLDESVAPTWKGLGLTFVAQKKTVEGIAALRRAAKLAPKDPEIANLLTGLLAFHGDIQPPTDLVIEDRGTKLKDEKIQPPLSQQAVFSEQQAVELGSILGLLALALLRPHWGLRQLLALEDRLRTWSMNPKRVMLVLFAFPLLVRLVLLPAIPVPVPVISDEFGYLLIADHFDNGQLTAPVHPLKDFFESIYILQKTSYTSVYPVAQSMVLAIPKALGMTPWIGVWLSVGVMCVALYWMLMAWLPGRWAIFGAAIAALRYSVLSHWMNTYWGGAVPAIGGALLLGSLGRLKKGPNRRYALTLGAGFAIVFQSRPYESLFLMTATCVTLLFWFGRSNRKADWIRLTALPLIAVVLLTGAFSAYYNYRVTGNPMLLPYQQYQQYHGAPQSFYYQKPIPQPPGLERYPDILAMYQWQLEQYNVRYSWEKLWQAAGNKFRIFWGFFLQPLWTVPVLLVPLAWRDRRVRVLLVIAAVVLIGISVYPFYFPHYTAPITGIILIAMVQGFRRIRLWEWRGSPAGAFVAFGIVLFTVAGILTPAGGTLWGAGRSPRSQVETGLNERGGKHLVLVRYGKNHTFHYTYTYNAANIDGSPIVWARDLGVDRNREILKYYSDRQAWLFQPDAKPPRLDPYDAAQAARTAAQ